MNLNEWTDTNSLEPKKYVKCSFSLENVGRIHIQYPENANIKLLANGLRDLANMIEAPEVPFTDNL